MAIVTLLRFVKFVKYFVSWKRKEIYTPLCV